MIIDFIHFIPLPQRFWHRDSMYRNMTSLIHEKVVIGTTDGTTNASPQQHFIGILRHLALLFRMPFVSDDVEAVCKRISEVIPGFMIGALCMMEAPYLFDDIVDGCVAVVNSLKGSHHDTIISAHPSDPTMTLPVSWKKGDWICVNCESHLRSIESICKCGTHKVEEVYTRLNEGTISSSSSAFQPVVRYPSCVEMLKVFCSFVTYI